MSRSPFTAWRREDLTPRELQLAECCIHEASHAVVGVLHGGRLKAAYVSGGVAGGTIVPRTTFTHSPAGYDAQVAFSGAYAQARWRAGNVRPSQAMVYAVLAADADRNGACGDAAMLADAGGTHAGAPVIELVERCWGPICALAGRIAADSSVRHTDVLAALGVGADPASADHELALIRSGCAPRSFTVTTP